MAFDLAEEHVLKAEAALGARLPDAYRQSMMRRNGGSIEIGGEAWTLIPILDGSDRKRLARTCNDIVRETRSCAEWRGFPPSAVAIAENGSGDRIVFLRDGDAYRPELHLWLHETGELELLRAGIA